MTKLILKLLEILDKLIPAILVARNASLRKRLEVATTKNEYEQHKRQQDQLVNGLKEEQHAAKPLDVINEFVASRDAGGAADDSSGS